MYLDGDLDYSAVYRTGQYHNIEDTLEDTVKDALEVTLEEAVKDTTGCFRGYFSTATKVSWSDPIILHKVCSWCRAWGKLVRLLHFFVLIGVCNYIAPHH